MTGFQLKIGPLLLLVITMPAMAHTSALSSQRVKNVDEAVANFALQRDQSGSPLRTNLTPAGQTPSTEGQTRGTQGRPISRPASPGTSIINGQSVPGAAKVVPAPATLSLEQAIQLAIDNNLTTLLARERHREAEGFKQQALSPLLPNVAGTSYQANLTENLAALGFQPGTFPGITRTFIGPFNNFDARARLVQTIFNYTALKHYKSESAAVRVADYEESLAKEQIAGATALLYLETLRSERTVTTSQANVDLAQTLLKLAQDQHNAGLGTGLDVTRAQARLSQERLRLAQANTSQEQARLNLQRVIGIPLGTTVTLTDPLRFNEETLPTAEVAVAQAQKDRPEMLIAEEQIRVNQLEQEAVRGEYLPSLEFVGDYGVAGITPNNTTFPTRRVAVQLNVPIFNGGLTRGRLTVASSQERQAQLELGSVRGEVEEDVRLALVTLTTAATQVRTANENEQLARQELEMSRDRFRAGVADNLEVTTAQTALANAIEAQTSALALYNAARVNLALALGRATTFRW